MANYTVNENGFSSFTKAVRFAQEANCDVVETATGIRRWTPAAAVSTKRIRRYNEQKAAYAAQEALHATKFGAK